jgi:membrane protein YqaA with SNARE-associated domain
MLNKKYSQTFNRITSSIWGFLESTIFFIVADVFLSYLVIKNNKRNVLISGIYCAAASTIGGLLIYILAKNHYELVYNLVSHIPLISENTIIKVESNLKEEAIYHIFLGGFSGIPYKIFAMQSSQIDISLPIFILVSFLSRLTRFLFTITIFTVFLKMMRKKLSDKALIYYHAGFWIIFYVNYAALTI